MSSKSRYLCGVPDKDCGGASTAVSQGLGGSRKTHGSSEDVFLCKEGNRFMPAGGTGVVIVS